MSVDTPLPDAAQQDAALQDDAPNPAVALKPKRKPQVMKPPRPVHDIRFKNYQALRAKFRADEPADCEDRGALVRFADYMKIESKYLSHIDHRRKPIGNNIAIKLEDKFGLTRGWLDIDHGDGTLVMDAETREFANLVMRLFLRDRDGVRSVVMGYMEQRLAHGKTG